MGAAPLDPVAAEVRTRMLRHLRLLPDHTYDVDDETFRHFPPTVGAGDLELIRARATPGAPVARPEVPPFERTASPTPHATVERSEQPTVSVVMVTFGTGPVAIDAIRSVATAEGPAIEVIVVDQPHPTRADATYTDLLLFTDGVSVVRPSANTGFGGGCELGTLFARGEYIAFVNPDTEVPSGWLEPLIDVLAQSPRAIIAPVLTRPDGSVLEAGQLVHADGATEPVTVVEHDAPFGAAYASAACWLVRREAHDRTGGFDPAYHPAYFEDVDLAYRARSLGGTLLVHPDVRVMHLDGRGTPDRPRPAHAQRALFADRWLRR